MSTKKYNDKLLQRYHYWRQNFGLIADFCKMKECDRSNLSTAYTAWKKRKGIK